MADQRTFAVSTAGFWFAAAERAKAEGKMQDAYLCMVNAFNHTENALFAARKAHAVAEREADDHLRDLNRSACG